MSKAEPASCVAGIVTLGALPLAGATILSEGVAASSGVAILDEGEAWYLPKNSGDIKSTLDNLSAALAQVKTALDRVGTTLTAIGAGMPSGTPPPTLAADVAVIVAASLAIGGPASIKTAVDLLKNGLK